MKLSNQLGFRLREFIFPFFIIITFFGNAQITSYPYVENFENGNGGWGAFGTNNSWELGTPDENLIINSAASGTAAWVTNLDGSYTDNENGYVQSPVFDLSVLSLPTVQLKIWWNCEFSWDGMVLQSSIDSGLSWQNVGAFGDSNNWFNDNSIGGSPGGQFEGWTGRDLSGNDSNGWVTATSDLSTLEGQSNVLFRVAFGSDGSVVDEGVAFDDFIIYSQGCYAGEDNSLFACVDSSSPNLDLNDLLSEGALSGGVWESESSNDSNLNLSGSVVELSSIIESGLYNFSYTRFGFFGCQDTALIQLNLQVTPFAGADTTTTVCGARGEIYLDEFLEEGVNVYSGVWESLNEPPVPIVDGWNFADFSDFSTGSYDFSYTMTSENCGPTDSAIVTIVIESFSAGNNGSLVVCNPFTEEDLFNALESDFFPPGPGGTWAPPINGPGIYTYTQAATANCPETSATVAVTEAVQLSAGVSTSLQSCSEVTLDDLLSELGGDPGGFWSPFFYSGEGTYTYTHPATDCTVESTATINFSFFPAPDAGSDGTVFDPGFGPANLNDLRADIPPSTNLERRRVDEGVWTQVFGPSTSLTDDGEVDFPNTGAGAAEIYEFEYTVQGNCGDAVAILTVEITGEDTAGDDGILVICPGENFGTSELFDALGGNPSIRGYWLETISGPGIYTYIAQDNAFFDADEATVTVIEDIPKSAGSNGTLAICQGDTPTDAELFAALEGSPDSGGVWDSPNAGEYRYRHLATSCYSEVSSTVLIEEELPKSAGANGTLAICQGETPTDAELLAALGGSPDSGGIWDSPNAGEYRYRHLATPCYPEVSAIVLLEEELPKSAGSNGTLAICQGEIPTDAELFAALGGSPDSGGVWDSPNTGEYRYRHLATPCFAEVSAIVLIEEELPKSAGSNGTLAICQGEIPTDAELFAALGGSPDSGGVWDSPNTGEYRYRHLATPCFAEVSAIVLLEEELPKSAGSNGTLAICQGETPTDAELLAALGGSPDSGGIWDSPNAGEYRYRHLATPCYAEVSATIVIEEELPKSAGSPGELNLCLGDTPLQVDLFNALGGNPDPNGSWSIVSPTIYEYSHPATACYDIISATVTILEDTPLSAGISGTLEIEQGATVTEVQLFDALGGNPDLGGIWTPELAGAGTYTYTHSGGACPDSSASVVVTNMLSINDDDLNSISVYPNPANQVIKIENSNNLAIVSAEIITISGQLVIYANDNFDEINVSRLEAAIYFLKIKTENGEKILKFIKK